MACHTPLLKKVKKQGEMPLPSLGPFPLKNVEFRDTHIHTHSLSLSHTHTHTHTCTHSISTHSDWNHSAVATGTGSPQSISSSILSIQNPMCEGGCDLQIKLLCTMQCTIIYFIWCVLDWWTCVCNIFNWFWPFSDKFVVVILSLGIKWSHMIHWCHFSFSLGFFSVPIIPKSVVQ